MRDSYLKGLAITTSGALFLAPDALLIKLTGDLGPFESTFLRSAFMAVSWCVMLRIWRGGIIEPLRSLSRLGVIAAVLLALDRLVFVAAVQTTTVANALTIFAAVPAFAALIAYGVLRERCGWVKCLAITASMLGIALIFGSDLRAEALWGNGLAALAALLFAVYIVCLRFARKDEVLESLVISGVIGALAALPFCSLETISMHSLMIVALQGLFLLPAGFGFYFTGTRYLPAAEVALIGLLEPVLGPVLAFMVLGEMPGGARAAGRQHRAAGGDGSVAARSAHASAATEGCAR